MPEIAVFIRFSLRRVAVTTISSSIELSGSAAVFACSAVADCAIAGDPDASTMADTPQRIAAFLIFPLP